MSAELTVVFVLDGEDAYERANELARQLTSQHPQEIRSTAVRTLD